MRLLNFIEQDDRIGATTHRFSKITTFLITDIAGRRTDQTGHRVLLHELGHIDAYHGLFGVEQELGQRLAQLGFTHAGRPKKQERTIGLIGVGQSRP